MEACHDQVCIWGRSFGLHFRECGEKVTAGDWKPQLRVGCNNPASSGEVTALNLANRTACLQADMSQERQH